jgi:beta-galactosidase
VGNDAYRFDYVEGENNMNEEWFGIVAKGRPNARGLYRVYPRTAYYVLRDACSLDPYGESTNLTRIRQHFGSVRPSDLAANYAAQQSMNRLDTLEMVRLGFLRVDFDTYTTGGDQLNVPEREETRFDHTQSFYFGIDLQPSTNVRANLTMNVLGNVAQNPINEIFYENRGIPQTFIDSDGEEVSVAGLDRLAVYQASFSWEESLFSLEGFYRVGQNHWGYDGDFFNLVPETHYGPAVDLFNANTPVGMVFNGRRELEGLRIAFGPELWWGANPTIIGMYHREMGPWEFSIMHQEDIAQRPSGDTSSAVPVPQDRRTTLFLGRTFGALRVELGGIMAGSPRVGRAFTSAREAEDQASSYLGSGFNLIDDEIRIADTFGAKARMRVDAAPFFWYLQGGYRGLVADGGWDPTVTITGWSLKESGQGNHWAVSTGAALNVGNFQIAPNFLLQRPLEGPLPVIDDFFDPATGTYFPGTIGRNQLQDPFWVRSNRETIGFELLIAFDPTPATWMWAWDNRQREDADFAAALDMTYRILPTIQDSGVGVSAEGFQFAFPTSAPAEDLWDVRLQTITNFSPRARLVNTIYVGNGQANGDNARLVYRGGAEGRFTYDRFALDYFMRIGDWGPYDYYRDFNQTFPFQGMLNASFGLGNPQWFVPAYTRFGVQAQLRTQDENSARYRPDPLNPNVIGTEWEIRTYVQLSL